MDVSIGHDSLSVARFPLTRVEKRRWSKSKWDPRLKFTNNNSDGENPVRGDSCEEKLCI